MTMSKLKQVATLVAAAQFYHQLRIHSDRIVQKKFMNIISTAELDSETCWVSKEQKFFIKNGFGSLKCQYWLQIKWAAIILKTALKMSYFSSDFSNCTSMAKYLCFKLIFHTFQSLLSLKILEIWRLEEENYLNPNRGGLFW